MSGPNVRGASDLAGGSSPRDGRQEGRIVAVVTTGGTIASGPYPLGGVVAAEGADDLLAAVPELRRIAEVCAEEIFRLGSYLLKPADTLRLARRVRALGDAARVDGVVVTHGTDAPEGSAYLVDPPYGGDLGGRKARPLLVATLAVAEERGKPLQEFLAPRLGV